MLSKCLFNNLLNNLFNFIPVIGRNSSHLDPTKVLSNGLQLFETLFIMNKRNGNTNSTKSTGSTNTVQISRRIRSILTIGWDVVVNHHRDRWDVDTSSEHIRGD
ncbi:hypothetical protein WICPIJ_003712 [Wickerhamomyces pijperi]|uniref:Uncharacterized protein n=1 Tax=Wickerhamomyces pijperi TaxID=599730 RepID=A0A9P8Q9B1_WICPI|nr:hypothetical protein WICPIJ_003712 [Wickerhamomyces pijperi]